MSKKPLLSRGDSSDADPRAGIMDAIKNSGGEFKLKKVRFLLLRLGNTLCALCNVY